MRHAIPSTATPYTLRSHLDSELCYLRHSHHLHFIFALCIISNPRIFVSLFFVAWPSLPLPSSHPFPSPFPIPRPPFLRASRLTSHVQSCLIHFLFFPFSISPSLSFALLKSKVYFLALRFLPPFLFLLFGLAGVVVLFFFFDLTLSQFYAANNEIWPLYFLLPSFVLESRHCMIPPSHLPSDSDSDSDILNLTSRTVGIPQYYAMLWL